MTANYMDAYEERERGFKRREREIKAERAEGRKQDIDNAQKQYPWNRCRKGLRPGRCHLF